jgi:tRNA-specific 2-thiouridylase
MCTPEGRRVGEHQGLTYYTIGQRQGLMIGGQKDFSTGPWFVAGKDMASNSLVVVQGHDHPLLYRSQLSAIDLSWIAQTQPDPTQSYSAKTRYRQTDAPCHISFDDDGMTVTFDQPQWAVTPGQSVVIYQDARCLGGGIILA